MKTFTSIAALIALGIVITGCSSTGYQKADNSAVSLRETAQSIDNTFVPIDSVLSALSDLVNNPNADISLQYQKYSAAVSKLESQAELVSNHAADMQKQAAAYLEKWDEELAKIRNDNIQTRSMDRKKAMTDRFEQVRVSYVQATVLFAPFLSDLKDIKTALATDLTAGGIASIKSLSGKANEKALPLRESMSRISGEFKSLGVALSTGTPTK